MAYQPRDFDLHGRHLDGAPETWEECNSELNRTKFAVKMLIECPYADVHRLLDGRKSLVRGLTFKKYWHNNQFETWYPNWKRREQFIGIAHYLFTQNLENGNCKKCREFQNCGPFAKCITGGREVFAGACFCCYTLCQGGTCPVRQAYEANAAEKIGEATFSKRAVEMASTRVIEQTKQRLLDELRVRGNDVGEGDGMELD